jgi:carbamoyl-phosphate synthase large subunit
VESVRTLLAEGFSIIATAGTHAYLTEQGLEVGFVKKVLEGRPHIVDAMKNGEVQLVINTTEGKQSLQDSFSLRRTALMMKIPYYTTTAGALAAAQAIGAIKAGDLDVRPIQDYAHG